MLRFAKMVCKEDMKGKLYKECLNIEVKKLLYFFVPCVIFVCKCQLPSLNPKRGVLYGVGWWKQKKYRWILETLKGCRKKAIKRYRSVGMVESFFQSSIDRLGVVGFYHSVCMLYSAFRRLSRIKTNWRSMIKILCEIRLNVLNLRKCLKSRCEFDFFEHNSMMVF